MVEAEVGVMFFEGGKRDQDPKNIGGFQKSMEIDCPLGSP